MTETSATGAGACFLPRMLSFTRCEICVNLETNTFDMTVSWDKAASEGGTERGEWLQYNWIPQPPSLRAVTMDVLGLLWILLRLAWLMHGWNGLVRWEETNGKTGYLEK